MSVCHIGSKTKKLSKFAIFNEKNAYFSYRFFLHDRLDEKSSDIARNFGAGRTLYLITDQKMLNQNEESLVESNAI